MILKDYKKIIYIMILSVIFLFITFIIKYYFKPFLSIIILLVMSSPIYKALVNIHLNKNIAAALSLFIINLIGMLIMIYLGNNIIYFFHEVYSNNMDLIYEFLSKFLMETDFNFNELQFFKSFFSFLKNSNFSIHAVSTGENLIMGISHNILAYFIGNICSFFILVDKIKFMDFLKILFPEHIVYRSAKEKKKFVTMIKIQGLLVFISAMEIMAGFYILGIEHGFSLSIICGFLDLLPYVGTIIVFVPIIIYNIIMRKYIISFGLICLYILVLIMREILEAKFLSNGLDIHPLVILLSLYIGMNIFGIIGIICGPLYSILAKEIIFYDIDKH